MKKISLIFILALVLVGCGSKDKTVTCKMEVESDEAGAEVTYTYNDNKRITKIENTSFLKLTKEELKENSLDEYYKNIETMYKEAKKEEGVSIEIKKDEKNNTITLNLIVDLVTYDKDEDILNVANEGNLENINDVVDLKKAMGYYTCGEVK